MSGDAPGDVDAGVSGSDTDAPPPVDVSDLSVSFGDLDAVRDVDLTVEHGELVGLVGPNGAGKTTVLRAIKGTLDPDAGTVRLAGDRVTALSAAETGRRVASVPQDTGLSFDFRVRHVVEMGRTPHLGRFSGHDADDVAAVDEAMAAAGVERFADRSIRAVSGGERQRVLLARALAQETPVVVLDEPTASLDVNHAVSTLELVRSLVDEGRAALAAIHDLDMAARYCDRIVLIADGRVHGDGPPESVLTRDTLSEAFDAAAFVGRSPATGTPSVTAFPRTEDDADPARVHVVGGGRLAARVVARLAAAGHAVTLGVVPEGDAAATVAADTVATSDATGGGSTDRADAEHGLTDVSNPIVTVPSFEQPTDADREAAAALAAAADLTVLVGEPAEPNRSVVSAADRVERVDIETTAEGIDGVLDAVRAAIGEDASRGDTDLSDTRTESGETADPP